MKEEKKGKKWYRSKSVFLGFVAIAIAAFDVLQNGGSGYGAVIGGLGAATMLIRAVTEEKVIW